MNVTLTEVFEEVPESEGGGYVAYTEELPEAISEGDTLRQGRDKLRDAVQLLTPDEEVGCVGQPNKS